MQSHEPRSSAGVHGAAPLTLAGPTLPEQRAHTMLAATRWSVLLSSSPLHMCLCAEPCGLRPPTRTPPTPAVPWKALGSGAVLTDINSEPSVEELALSKGFKALLFQGQALQARCVLSA